MITTIMGHYPQMHVLQEEKEEKKHIKHYLTSLIWFGLNHSLNYIEHHNMWKIKYDKKILYGITIGPVMKSMTTLSFWINLST